MASQQRLPDSMLTHDDSKPMSSFLCIPGPGPEYTATILTHTADGEVRHAENVRATSSGGALYPLRERLISG